MDIRKVGNSVPIVGLTGNALDEQRVEFLACGADAVLTKPLNRSRFEHVVHRFMSMEISYKWLSIDVKIALNTTVFYRAKFRSQLEMVDRNIAQHCFGVECSTAFWNIAQLY